MLTNFESLSHIQVIKHAVDNEKLVTEYETMTTNLRDWIVDRTLKLEERTFGNSLLTVQQQLMEFNLFRTQEKPPKYVVTIYFQINFFLYRTITEETWTYKYRLINYQISERFKISKKPLIRMSCLYKLFWSFIKI